MFGDGNAGCPPFHFNSSAMPGKKEKVKHRSPRVRDVVFEEQKSRRGPKLVARDSSPDSPPDSPPRSSLPPPSPKKKARVASPDTDDGAGGMWDDATGGMWDDYQPLPDVEVEEPHLVQERLDSSSKTAKKSSNVSILVFVLSPVCWLKKKI